MHCRSFFGIIKGSAKLLEMEKFMDYGIKGVNRKIKTLKSSSRKFKSKMNVMSFRILIVTSVSLVIIGIFAGVGLVAGLFDSAPSLEGIDVVPTNYSTYIYDSNGTLIQTIVGSDANREYVAIEEIPDVVEKAFISIEDERFYEHDGIDVRGIFRAAFVSLSSGFSEGASTLTQQLIKNQVFDGGMEKTVFAKFERKLQEQYLAIQLENELEKDEILEYYLNTINLGANTLGVQTASKRYFGKSVSELNASEAAVIAAITQNPEDLNPITNRENNEKRRNKILKNMLSFEYITQEEYDSAMNDDVYARIEAYNKTVVDTTKANTYFVDALYYQVINDLQVYKGYSYKKAVNTVYRGGLRIYSTQNPEIQAIVDEEVNNLDNYPDAYDKKLYELVYALSVTKPNGETKNYSEGHLKNYFTQEKGMKKFDLFFANKEDATEYIEEYKNYVLSDGSKFIADKVTFTLQPEVSFTIMDQHTGHVVAISGGRGEKTASLTLNRATDSKRQPGSTFKIVSAYLPAIDSANMTLSTMINDSVYYYPGTSKKVQSWRGYHKGPVSIREAIWDSNNVVAVKTLEQITPELAFDYLMKLGFTTLVEGDKALPTALGGITYGVTNEELTAAYATIANNGLYQEPIYYTKILDHDGNVLLERKPETKQVIKESTAYLLTSAMEDTLSNKGTGKQAGFDGMHIAGKTGTTTNKYDLWFAGYTPYYTATIWSGYDNNNEKQSNSSYHKVLWKKIMSRVHEGLPDKEFDIPSSVITAKICAKCGKLYNGVSGKTEYFAIGTVPIEKCTCKNATGDSTGEKPVPEDTIISEGNDLLPE